MIPPPPRVPDPTTLAATREAALDDLRLAGGGVRVTAAREALEQCREVLDAALEGAGRVAGGEPRRRAARRRRAASAEAAAAGGEAAAAARPRRAASRAAARRAAARGSARRHPPWPGPQPAELKGGAKALTSDACEAYRTAWTAYRSACADYHAGSALALIDALLSRYGAAYDDKKAERAAIDFDDLELRARDLLGDAPTREKWAARFELIMIDEFQDTNAVQLGILESLERDNLFAVGDEFQSIYRFRHADVNIFRNRAHTLDPREVRRLAVNFRSREELLDALNAGVRT